MRSSKILTFIIILMMIFVMGVLTAQAQLAPIEELGKRLFFDTNLSTSPGQSCAACHAPEAGFTGPNSAINNATAVYPGAVHTRFGNRKPPTAAYGGDSPVLDYNTTDEVWVGGMFWDGRATGKTLGDPLAEQAQGPFLNPLEQNTPSAKQVCIKVKHSDYAKLFEEVWGPGSLDPVKDVEGTYERIARSIAAYERSAEVNPFSSKYDAFLAGEPVLTAQEAEGLELFNGKGGCSGCHLSEGEKPLFTDFTYDNLGVPKNPDNPFYSIPKKWNPDGKNWIDPGLGGFLMSAGYPPAVYEPEWGKQKVPTLRNVDKRPYPGFIKAFGHNGYFKSLEDIVHFYNTRDVEDWPDPEVPQTVNDTELGNLGLTLDEEAAIVAFMKTLTDGYTTAAAPPLKPVLASASLYDDASGFQLFQNSPNPFNPETWIPFAIGSTERVMITIYELQGHLVRKIDLGDKSAGVYVDKDSSAYWDGANERGEKVASGVYYYNIQAGRFNQTKKMVIQK